MEVGIRWLLAFVHNWSASCAPILAIQPQYGPHHVNSSVLADEVDAIVVDMGSYQCKAGYSGEDTPKVVFGTVRYSDRLCARRFGPTVGGGLYAAPWCQDVANVATLAVLEGWSLARRVVGRSALVLPRYSLLPPLRAGSR